MFEGVDRKSLSVREQSSLEVLERLLVVVVGRTSSSSPVDIPFRSDGVEGRWKEMYELFRTTRFPVV